MGSAFDPSVSALGLALAAYLSLSIAIEFPIRIELLLFVASLTWLVLKSLRAALARALRPSLSRDAEIQKLQAEFWESLRRGEPLPQPPPDLGGGVMELRAASRIVRVRASARISGLNEWLLRRGWMLPLFPVGPDAKSSVGELICGDFAGGAGSHRYGFLKDVCVGYEVLLSSGEVRRVTEASDGQLFFALPWSRGSLGLVLTCELRLVPAPADSFLELRVTRCDEGRSAFAHGLRRSAQVRTYDPNCSNPGSSSYAPGAAGCKERPGLRFGSLFGLVNLEAQFGPSVPDLVLGVWVPAAQRGVVLVGRFVNGRRPANLLRKASLLDVVASVLPRTSNSGPPNDLPSQVLLRVPVEEVGRMLEPSYRRPWPLGWLRREPWPTNALPRIVVPGGRLSASVARLERTGGGGGSGGRVFVVSPVRILHRNNPPRGSGLQALRFFPPSDDMFFGVLPGPGFSGSHPLSVEPRPSSGRSARAGNLQRWLRGVGGYALHHPSGITEVRRLRYLRAQHQAEGFFPDPWEREESPMPGRNEGSEDSFNYEQWLGHEPADYRI